MSAQVQGEIMSFSSVLGIMMVSMRMDEVMRFTPLLVIMMAKVSMMGAARRSLSACGVSDVLGTLTSCPIPLNKQIPGIPFHE